MFSCGVPGCTNSAGKKSNIIALATQTMLLWPYHNIFKTLAHLVLEAYSKPCQIYDGEPDIVKTVYSGIYRHIHGHLATFNHGQAYWRALRHIQAFSDIFWICIWKYNTCI